MGSVSNALAAEEDFTDMTERHNARQSLTEYAAALAEAAPPLTEEQVERAARLLATVETQDSSTDGTPRGRAG